MEEIGTAACKEWYKLTQLTFPSQVKEVKSNTFLNCLSLTTINIHKDIISVAPDFVRFCSRLKNINVDSDNLYYKDIDGAFYNKTGDSLIVTPGDNDKYTLDPATQYIWKNTFACCSMKPNLEIPS